MTDIHIPSWDEFQHYRHRSPPWIRLYRKSVLDNRVWARLDDFAARLLVELRALASEGDPGGTIDLELDELAFRLRHDSRMLAFIDALEVLARAELVVLSHDYASTMLARRLQITSVTLSSVEGRDTPLKEVTPLQQPQRSTSPIPAPKAKSSPEAWLRSNADATEVWEHWKARRQEALEAVGALSNPKAVKPTRPRMIKLHRALITDGNTVNDLKEAIDGCTRDPKNRAAGYIDLELILRSQEHIDRFRVWSRSTRGGSGRAAPKKRTGRYDHIGDPGAVPEVPEGASDADPQPAPAEPVPEGAMPGVLPGAGGRGGGGGDQLAAGQR